MCLSFNSNVRYTLKVCPFVYQVKRDGVVVALKFRACVFRILTTKLQTEYKSNFIKKTILVLIYLDPRHLIFYTDNSNVYMELDNCSVQADIYKLSLMFSIITRSSANAAMFAYLIRTTLCVFCLFLLLLF